MSPDTPETLGPPPLRMYCFVMLTLCVIFISMILLKPLCTAQLTWVPNVHTDTHRDHAVCNMHMKRTVCPVAVRLWPVIVAVGRLETADLLLIC